MRIHTLIILLSITLLTPACAGDLSRPTIWSSPSGYLEGVRLGITQEKAMDSLGVPDEQMQFSGKDLWVYIVGEGWGLRKFTYVFVDGILDDVKYNDQGPYNGITAKQVQTEK